MHMKHVTQSSSEPCFPLERQKNGKSRPIISSQPTYNLLSNVKPYQLIFHNPELCSTLDAIHLNDHDTERPHIASELNTTQHHLCEVDDALQLTNNHHKAEISTKFECASQKYSMSICLTGGVMNKTVHKTQLKTPPTVSVWIKDNCNYCTTCFR